MVVLPTPLTPRHFGRQNEVVEHLLAVVAGKHLRDLVGDETVELGGADIFVALDAGLKAFDDFQRGVDTDVAGDENILEVVEDLVVDFALACNGTCYLAENARFSPFKTFVERLLLFFGEKFAEKAHTIAF